MVFYPKAKHLPGIIIELKADASPEAALKQIREKEYCEKLLTEGVRKILLTGISYDTARKPHQCRIEEFLADTPAAE